MIILTTLYNVSGVYTGSVYTDPNLQMKGFRGEGIFDGRVVVIKTHERPGKGPREPIYFDKALLIIRHPKDAVISYFLTSLVGHTGLPKRLKYFKNVRESEFTKAL